MGKGLASAIDSGEKVVDSTKQTLGSAKRKSTDTTQQAKGMAQEKMDQASESTERVTETARHKVNQAAGEAGNKAEKVRLFSSPPLIGLLIYTCAHSRSKPVTSGPRMT